MSHTFNVRMGQLVTNFQREITSEWLGLCSSCRLLQHNTIRCLHGTAHTHIAETSQLASSIEGRCRFRSTDAMDERVSATRCSTFGLLVIFPLRKRLLEFGTLYRRMSGHLLFNVSSITISKLNCFVCYTLHTLFVCAIFVVKCSSNGIAMMWHYNLNI